ncbi:MAG: proteasome subunit alpha [Geodermatophilaceae bacterium]
MPFYASVEQIMRDRSELARKGIARGRSVAVLSYADGVLFIAENSSTALRKVSEIYDRIGFAAVGRYSEFDNLRTAGIRLADMRGYSYDRRDVTGWQLANSIAHALNSIFTEQQKPYEVELCVAEVGATAAQDQLYRVIYYGSIFDEPGFVVMGGQAEAMTTSLRGTYQPGLPLADALALGVRALASVGGANGAPRMLPAEQLEVAVLDRSRPQRAFRRITGSGLSDLLPAPEPAAEPAAADAADAGDVGRGDTVVPLGPTPDPHPGEPPSMPHPEIPAGGETTEVAAQDADGEPGKGESGPPSEGNA